MTDNVVAKSLRLIKDSSKYTDFKEGYFTNRPKMTGYIQELPDFNSKVYFIVNTSKEDVYDKNYYADDGYHFIIYNAPSMDEFQKRLPEEAADIIKLLTDISNQGVATGEKLPYGYTEDEEGEIKVVPQEANKVRKIFKEYVNNRSIRKVAAMFKEDYSFIHDLLHDVRYSRMPIKIIPDVDLKKVNLIIQQNTKNKRRKEKLKRFTV